MNTMRFGFSARTLWSVILGCLALLTLSSTAFAFGTVRFKSTKIDEVDGRWKVEMDIDYGSKPHMGHIPFDFVFEQKTYFENSITDQDPQPVVRPKPMHNQTPQREELDIGFADPRGDIWPHTKFSFSLRRDRGFAAGEYTLIIRRTSDGQQLGRTVTLTLNGQNELIDRRAMVFAGDKKPSKGPKADAAAASSATAAASAKPEESTAPAGSSNTDPTPPPEATTAPTSAPAPVEKRPGAHGCGCSVPQSSPSSLAGLGALAVALGFGLRRRRG